MSLDTLDPSVALVPADRPATPLPLFRGPEMTQALTAYRELQQALDRAMPEQIISLDGKPYRKKAYWRAIAVAFHLTVELVEERREVFGTLADGEANYHYFVTYKASTLTGRCETGDGACSASEKQRGRMKATEHNVRAHAHTRAFNRAISNLVGFGEVSAEEVDRDEARPVVTPRVVAQPAGYDDFLSVLTTTADQGTAALQRAWTGSAREYRAYLTTTAPDRWAALKAHAARQGAS